MRFLGETTEDGFVIDYELELVDSTGGSLAIIPQSDRTDGSWLIEDYGHKVGFSLVRSLRL